MYPANQLNLDTQLAAAKLLLAIHSARNSAEVKPLHSDCLTVKLGPLRKHVQPQIYHDHGSLSAFLFYFGVHFILFFYSLFWVCVYGLRPLRLSVMSIKLS